MSPQLKQLSFLDRFLTPWIFIAMSDGVMLGYTIPGGRCDHTFQAGPTNVPTTIDLIEQLQPLCRLFIAPHHFY